MRKIWEDYRWIPATAVGSAVFALGFSLFLQPNEISPGGISGLALVAVELLGYGSVGVLTILINLPLFILGGVKIGRRFFCGSLLGMVLSSILIDAFAKITMPPMDSLLCALYGGMICGLGLGRVFICGTSTGGSDIVVRLLKLKYRDVPIGQISMCFDSGVAVLTGIVFQDITKALAHSCNYFFYEIGFRLGINDLNKWGAQLGLTSKTGIELNGEATPFIGSQDKLYDADRAVNDQYTSKPIIAYNLIIAQFKEIAADRGDHYDEDKMAEAAKMILDLADSDLAKDQWTSKIYEILQVELGIPRSYIANHLLGNVFYYMINDLRWTASETIMAAIGQSITQVTPISVARYVSAIANGGTVYNAQIVDKIISPTGEVVLEKQPVVANVIEGADEYLAAIRRGMEDVSAGEEGTATKYFAGAKYTPAAKTGTSQRTELDVENNAWLVSYAPIDDPKIVVVVYVQNGYAGSHTAKAAWTVSDAYLESLEEKESTVIANENSLAE